MFIIFLILLLTAIIIFFGNKNEATKWASFFLVCAAFGALSRTIFDSVIPTLINYNLENNLTKTIVFNVYLFMAFLGNSCTPYGVLIFSLIYSELFKKKTIKISIFLFAIPVIAMLIFNSIRIDFLIPLIIWVTFYLILSCGLLIYTWLKELNLSKKKEKFRTVLILIPSLISALLFNYFARMAFPHTQYFRYVIAFIIISFILFIVFSFIDNALGVKLRLERQMLDNTIRAMTSGTTIINHTIKNEIGKISMAYYNIKSLPIVLDHAVEENLEILFRAKEHLLVMVEKINSQMQEIVLEEAPTSLVEIVEESLASISFYFKKSNKNIRVERDYQHDPIITCDRDHMKEVIMNIIKNAFEAINVEGSLFIRIIYFKNKLMLSIKDNGSGIREENKSSIFSPFFSTKTRNLNFGLGLSYCYNVMQKSGAILQFESLENDGTTFFLVFPKGKLIQI